jgi:uncharacterized membrane protein YfcA
VVWVFTVLVLFVLAVWLHGGFDLKTALMLLGLCFACELVDSGLGMGYGTILTPVLLLLGYSPADIVPTVLLSELLSGFTAASFHHQIRNVDLSMRGADLKPALLLAGGSVTGVTAGVLIAVSLPKTALSLAIGCIIMISGLFVIILSRRSIRYRVWKMLLLSMVASFNKAVSGGGYGPLVTSGQILSGVQSKSSVGITSFAEAFTCLLAVTLFLLKGGYINLLLFIPMAAGALASVPFAVFAINRTREHHLKLIIGFLTFVMGALTIAKALS